MTHDARINDEQLTARDIRQLENADEIARFFARLRYTVDERITIADYTILGLGNQDVQQQILRLERIGTDPEDGDITIYLFEVRSVTARLRNEIARRFRDRPENALLVLTHDYSELDFVLLHKSEERSQSKFQPLKLVIRPIALTVNRTNPDLVALRVLKRFTFTEADSAYQWEKLQSAYTLAEWSEQYFNNRALFSDYYLNERLTDARLTPEWDEDVRPVGREVFKRLVSARESYSGKPESAIRDGLYAPIFGLLGFNAVAQPPSAGADRQADYLLYAPGDGSTPVAAALTYVWNRNLDAPDEAREEAESGGAFEIPGATVVSLLEAKVAPWVIVTNGKLWRLYSATASNKATNYYEVDLEEALASTEQTTALKYWWLLFRHQAFTGFLETLLKNSAAYAKELGDRLKDRVFVEIFPQFAKGFIADMRARSVTVDDSALAAVFSGTLTFLYRVMFILYAESLDLLPVNEAHGYREQSLARIKAEIAAHGGTLISESPEKLRTFYQAGSTALYDRLQNLFTVIDQGSDALNMPTYNGGLFSPATAEGSFLATYTIPDRFLAVGLDRLARDVDSRSKALVFIDFKSLGVRQLGSIYEGLLEFRLRIAAEQLAVTKEKNKEVYQPFAAVKKPLATIEKGDVYLENDKKERKATGSYYTPDYIVKYIVQHTVGPVLDRMFTDLAPRLHAAQKGFRDYTKLVQARQKSSGRQESPAVYWNEPPMQRLVDECLNVRVLDPAMGSGHFLVEVVDYASNRLISFLNGWSENPVWAFIDQTRSDILDEMERQHVSIDAGRLTRVALLKRAVLKRCIYGVDLNPMAVELAKVSLWLDAFTLGAPLSFLDHHLKHGNSLVGARIKEVQKYLEGGTQMHMLEGSEFAGVMLATDLMRQVSYLSDNTVAQSRQSAAAYRDASDHLAPYKRMLDVYTSRWFGNAPPKKVKTDYVNVFLRDASTRDWLHDPATPLSDSLIPSTAIAATALGAAREKRFFHWELEFPEVFFAPATPGGQDVQLVEGGGFDAVVGNPPYIRVQTLQKDDFDYFAEDFRSASQSYDIYALFIEQGLRLINIDGKETYIVPHKFLESNYGSSLRNLISNGKSLFQIVHFGDIQIFKGATTYICLLILTRNSQDSFKFIGVNDLDRWPGSGYVQGILESDELHKNEWNFNIGLDAELIAGLMKNSKRLGDISDIFVGIQTSADEVFILEKSTINTNDNVILYSKSLSSDVKMEIDLLHPIISGSDVDRYGCLCPMQYLLFPYELHNDQIKVISFNEIRKYYPHTADYLLINREILENRENGKLKGKDWHGYIYLKNMGRQEIEKLCVPRLIERLTCAYDVSGQFYLDNVDVGGVTLNRQLVDYSYLYICALLNSQIATWYIRKISTRFRGNYVSANKQFLSKIPVFNITFTTPAAERERLTRQAIAAYDAGDSAGLMGQAQAAIAADQTDVVHDLLAHLAQRMIDLNKAKQTEVRRFLGWLEGRLKIQPKNDETGIDSLKGKSIIQNYLGDYQKGAGPVGWRDFHYRLHENRGRYAVALSDVEGQIEQEYEKTLQTLLPIKADLSRTDALIDKIVYRLYGLSDAEIELIERPQYEQALTEAKAQVVANAKLTDDEEKLTLIAEGMLPAAERFFERIEPTSIEAMLDRELPNWRTLPPAAPTFLLTGDYNLSTLSEQMDFSASVIPYTKAVEVVLQQRIFTPFRERYTDSDCANSFLQEYMLGKRKLTLGNFMILLSSSKEIALRSFVSLQIADAATRVYGPSGMAKTLNDNAIRDIRNKAAHAEVIIRSEAQQVRVWTIGILGLV